MSQNRLTREESQRQTRRKLLQVAAEMFAQKGFHHTSLEQIAEEAGFSKGAVYSNFGSKDDLFLAVFSENLAEDLKGIEELSATFTSIDAFIQAIDRNHQAEREQNKAWGILKLEFLLYAMRNETAREKLAPILQESRQAMAHLLGKLLGQENKEVSFTSDELALLLLSLDIGIGIQAYVDETSIPEHVFSKGLGRLLDE